MRRRTELVKIVISTRKDKKYAAHFSDGTITHFGGKGCGDYIKYSKKSHDLADEKRRQYIKRHGAMESWTDPTTAATLSRYILWEKRGLRESIRYYRRKFKV